MKVTSWRRRARRDLRHAGVDDALLQVRVRERDVEVQAAPLQRVGDFPGVVGLVRNTMGGSDAALTVPISGIETW